MLTKEQALSGPAIGNERDDFAAWMSARQSRLLRTAYLLTGDRGYAEDLVEQTATADP